ncbi:hypothetical protein KEM54_001795, partial [Ascosphaera aggregata]
KRRITFNLHALRKAAAEAVGAKECVQLTKFPEGNFNKAFLLEMDDGREVVAKLPNPNAGIPSLTTASEVASMDFFRRVTKTPAPRVLSYCADTNNPMGSEYIIMEKVKGVVLSSVWGKLSLESKKKIVLKLLRYHKAWADITFEQYGSIYFPRDLGLKPGEHCGLSYKQGGKDIMSTQYVVGPAVGREWTSEGKNITSIYNYKAAALKRERQAIASLNNAFPKQTGMICGPAPFYLSTADKKLKALGEYEKLLQHGDLIFPEDIQDLFKGHIWHDDMHTENIFVDSEDNTVITGIVDWQSSQIAPLIDHCLDPHLLPYGLCIGDSTMSITSPGNMRFENSREKVAFEDTALINSWRRGVKKDIAKQHLALEFKQTAAGRILHLARNLLGPSEAHLAIWLKFLRDDWQNMNKGAEEGFPIRFSPLRLQEIRSDFRRAVFSIDTTNALRNRMASRLGKDLWPDAGFIPSENYDLVKETLEAMKKELLENYFPLNSEQSTAQDRALFEKNNKIRAALGLKPLPVPGGESSNGDGPTFRTRDESSSSEDDEPGSTLEKREAMAGENWRRLQEEQEAKKRREERNEAIRRAREAAQRNAKLEGKSLGEVDMEMDTKTWLSQAKKKQKEIEKERARKLAEELEERERERAVEYTSEDLSGVRVGHELDDFGDDGGEQVLTLKDTTIDEDEVEGDELENVQLREKEKTKERLELKKKKLAYDPNADGSGSSILAQYDDEIEGKKAKRFTLDSMGLTVGSGVAKPQDVSSKSKSVAFSLDDVLQPVTTSDYQEPAEIKIKKPRKKKTKSTRKRRAEDDDVRPNTNQDTMDVDHVSGSIPVPKVVDTDINLDNEDLAASLASQRRAALKKRRKMTPEELARQLKEESLQSGTNAGYDQEDADGDPGVILNDTSEFVANLSVAVEDRQRSVSAPPKEVSAATDTPTATGATDEAIPMEAIVGIAEEREFKQESVEQVAPKDVTSTGLAEESELNQGLGSTLAMLKQRGLVKDSNASELNALHRDRQRFLQEKYRLETEAEQRARFQRERDRASGRFDRMSGRDREEFARQENKARDQMESRQLAEIFNREYKPDVQLKYVDEHGRLLDQKEAFKHLSHQFHGKGSGKMKTEKHLKKIQDEKKREAMSTLDSSQHTGMNNAMGVTAKKNKQAGVRLG